MGLAEGEEEPIRSPLLAPEAKPTRRTNPLRAPACWVPRAWVAAAHLKKLARPLARPRARQALLVPLYPLGTVEWHLPWGQRDWPPRTFLHPKDPRHAGTCGAIHRTAPHQPHRPFPYEFPRVARQVPPCAGRRLLPTQNPEVSRASACDLGCGAGSLPAARWLSASVHSSRTNPHR